MTPATGRPVGFAAALAAELHFLLALRWIAIGLLTLTAFAVNRLVDERGLLFQTPPWGWLWIMAMIWASLVWSGERPAERGLFAAAPFPTPWHEIARIAAGAIYLSLPITALLVGEDVFGTRFSPHSVGFLYVFISCTGALTLYLLAACLAMVSSWPAAWFVGLFLGLNLLALKAPAWLAAPASKLFGDRGFGFIAALVPVRGVRPAGSWARLAVFWLAWAPAAALWLGVALLLVAAVAHRRVLGGVVRRVTDRLGLRPPGWRAQAPLPSSRGPT